MKPRSLLAIAILGIFTMQPLTNLATAAPGKTSKVAEVRKKTGARPAAAKRAAAPAAKARKATAKTRAPRAAATRAAASRSGAKARTASTVRKAAAAPRAPAARAMKVSLRKSAPVASLAPGAAAAAAEREIELTLDRNGFPELASSAFYVVNPTSGEVLLERNAAAVLPIASITKLMTAMVVLDGGQRLSEPLTISEGDIDTLKGTGSRLGMGTTLTRAEMLQLALMSSENRAASALARHYPGGERAFVEAMNVKARLLGLWSTRFRDSTGLNPGNVSSPSDLAKMVAASSSYPLIREYSTASERHVDVGSRSLRFGNTNSLVKSPEWAISVSKTGYISEAGRCLVMHAWLHQQPVVIVLMDSSGRYTRTADAQRVRKWLEQSPSQRIAAAPAGIEG